VLIRVSCGVQVDILLDPLFPVVVELAEESSNRQTKVMACELLHSFIVFLVGHSAGNAQRGGT
jgi:DNA-dependent protein kinase catalytic subunit